MIGRILELAKTKTGLDHAKPKRGLDPTKLSKAKTGLDHAKLPGLGGLGQDVHRGLGIVLERVYLVGEVAPLDELHAEVALAFVIADLVDRVDPRVGVVPVRSARVPKAWAYCPTNVRAVESSRFPDHPEHQSILLGHGIVLQFNRRAPIDQGVRKE